MCAIIKNPLQRDGTSQKERLLKALLPENAKIDDRKIEDILTFATEYSKLINYYNADNTIQGDWSCFYENDPCIQLALLATIDTDSIEAAFKALEEKINNDLNKEDCGHDSETTTDPLPGYYDDIINIIYSVAMRIQMACKKLPDGHLLKEEIITIIKSNLHLAIIDNKQQDALVKLIGYDKASIAPLNEYKNFIQSPANSFCACTKAWQLDAEGYDCIYPDNSFGLAELKVLFYLFFIELVKIKGRAAIYFETCIAANDAHQPHVTLFLTFLYLFQYAIDQLNTLTRSHLLYYYEKVLCLHKLKEVPDKVHVIFELAKNFHTHLIEEGTLLNAGKDDSGRQMVYAILEEVIVNNAKVEEVKTIYINNQAEQVTIAGNAVLKQTATIHVAPVANSKDGMGDSFAKEEQVKWQPLGGVENASSELGFALASPMFMLSEGIRDIRLSFKLDQLPAEFKNTVTPFLHDSIFRLEYSNGKDWVEMNDVSATLMNSPFVVGDLVKYNTCFDLLSTVAVPGSAAAPITKDGIKKLIRAKKMHSPSHKIAEGAEDDFQKDAEGAQKTFYFKIDFTTNTLDFLIHINEFAPPFTVIDTQKNKYPIQTAWPVLKIFIKKDNSSNKTAYTVFKDIMISNIDIKTDIKGVKNLTVQNDTTILNPSREFFPFGIRPETGAGFYIGSKEIFQKKLDRLDIELEWANLPLDIKPDQGSDTFATYYKNYILPAGVTVDNAYFKVSVEYLYNRTFKKLLENQMLFVADNGKLPENQQRLITVKTPPPPDMASIAAFTRFPSRNLDLPEYTIDSQRGFIRLKLQQNFFHGAYANSLTKGAIIESAKGKTADGSSLPLEPFTPALKNISLSYASSESVAINMPLAGAVFPEIYEEFFHILPFGYKPIGINATPLVQQPVVIAPQFNYTIPQNSVEAFTQGNLYIGLKDALPEQKINILFQVLDGTGDNRVAQPDIEWSYLVNNEWQAFKPFEIQDHTRADESSRKSLLKSGIIEFSLPKAITSKGTTILNPDLLWIRAVAHEGLLTTTDSDSMLGLQRIAALPDIVAIIAQAGIAAFENHTNALSHLAAPLPAKTIAKLVDSRAAIKKAEQPFNSFDGRLPENDNQFYTRVNERLRHKNRAICIWDYERLVLQAFPQLHKVKCLNHTGIAENLLQTAVLKLREITPGFVTVSVIPDLRNNNAINKIEPRVPVGILDDIKLFLKRRTNLFVALAYTDKLDYLQVLNPLYEQLKVKTCVRFYEGLDAAYYKYVLNEDLKKFLSPWAFDANKEINFGSTYHKSTILNFIEERKYVDVVLGFEVLHYKDGTVQPDYDADRIIPTTSRSILTSYNVIDANAEYEHNIENVPYDENNPCPECTITANNALRKQKLSKA
ncbi:hypothetical protein [Ferruginibacter profundus]